MTPTTLETSVPPANAIFSKYMPLLGPVLRLVLALLILGWALLTIFQAPSIFLWYFAIIATEYGQWLLLLPLTLVFWEIFVTQTSMTIYTVGIAGLAACLFLVPAYQAWSLSRYLPLQLTEAYGTATPLQSAFSLSRLWSLPTHSGVVVRNLEFTTSDGSKLALDFYSCNLTTPRPCVVVVHGGGWNSGDCHQLPGLNFALAAAGYQVAAIDYRLSPGSQWPAQKEDLLAALSYLRQQSASLRVDPDRFIILGRSAGGQIALATSYGVNDPGIRGCIALYAPTDMVFAYRYGSDDDILKSRSLLRSFLGGSLEDKLANYQDASPKYLVSTHSPATLVIHGTRDELVWYLHSHRLQTAVLEAHRPFFLLEMPWATHAFDLNVNGPAGQLSVYSILWFMECETK